MKQSLEDSDKNNDPNLFPYEIIKNQPTIKSTNVFGEIKEVYELVSKKHAEKRKLKSIGLLYSSLYYLFNF